LILLEAAIGIEPMNKGFADLCLTTWLRRLNEERKNSAVQARNEVINPKVRINHHWRKKRRKDEELPSFQFAVFNLADALAATTLKTKN
jgi:hypothetical protein